MTTTLRRPAPLRAGDQVALVAPCGPCDVERLELGSAFLAAWGLAPRALAVSDGCRPADSPLGAHHLAGSDRWRAAQLIEAFADPEVRAVLAVRGGSGAARLAGAFSPAEHCRAPKMFVGFSDVTTLLSRLIQEAHLVCYHGPMIAADLPRLSEPARERFRRFLFGEDGWFDGRTREVWRGGTASGRLLGGCLSVIVTGLGTPYELDTRDSILFLEDVAEKPYRIDRMLTHLKHAGKLDSVRGLVFGPMTDCDDGVGHAVLREIALDVVGDLGFPVLFGLEAGHGADNVVLPLGCRVGLDGERGRIVLEESAFA